MVLLGVVPRRCVNLPPGSLGTILRALLGGNVREGTHAAEFERAFETYLDAPHVFGAATGRSAFQMALEALDLPAGSEVVFPCFTFPVMPMVAKNLGLVPVFCDVDPITFNSGPEHVEAVLTERTSAVLATHLFGRPCPIEEIAALTKARGIRLLEDCAHALGLRVNGKQVGTFGDIGMFSFAQGKNMPCLGGGAIAVMDDATAERARAILDAAEIPETPVLRSEAISVWLKWFLTRPTIFGATAYPALRLKQAFDKPLMDSAVGDELVNKFQRSNPKVERLGNLQGAIGLLQLQHIDRFNAGARRNGDILTAELEGVPGVRVALSTGEHIYVYYPLRVDADKRDSLRAYLLRHGVDTKLTDMSDCRWLEAFRTEGADMTVTTQAMLLEICVYPTVSEAHIRHAAKVIRDWAGVGSSDGSPKTGETAKV
jgi:dTDP-4-amino-4,6-dideoxygalactose transaminase